MWEQVTAVARDLTENLGPADIADIGVISLIVYGIVVWVRETASYRVLVGLMLLAAVYSVARTFNMVMTSQLLHMSLAVLLVVLAIIFQEDLRRGLERVAAFESWRVIGESATRATDLDMLVETSIRLAARKTGALIVIPGTEDLLRHVHGGIELDGRASKPLLDSLFDPHSAGHDGAVIVQGGRVTRFAVHLPISKNSKQVGSHGTRHAAAIGLTEQTDAFVIVVSEERGVVSVSERGRLRPVKDGSELKERLERFAYRKQPIKREPTWSQWVLRDWRARFGSVALASLAWLVIAYNPSTLQRTFVVPIEYRNIPKTLELSDWAPTETRVTLSGTEPAFRLLEPATLRIGVDLSTATQGVTTVHLTQKNLVVPPNLTVYRMEHATLTLVISERDQSAAPASARP